MVSISRRTFTLGGLSGALTGEFLAAPTIAVAAPLDPSDPQAKALGFAADATKVDAAANPTFKASQKCASCVQYQGKPTDANAPCTIFAGKTVPAAGWCKVWVQRPAA